MSFEFFRIHPAGESIETILDPRRPDGWVASDEDVSTQPHGVSCCETEEDLRSYVRLYSLAVQPGDVLVRVLVRVLGSYAGPDRDQHAVRVIAESVEIVCAARVWLDGVDE